jgi:hypothetical protein
MSLSVNPSQQSVLNRASKDKFLLVLDLPYILKKQKNTNSNITVEPLTISVHGTIVPQIQVPSIETRFGGQSVNVSSYSRPNYPPLDVNFIVDNSFKNYWILWQWLTILNSPTGSYYTGTDSKYQNYKDLLNSGILTEYQSNFSIFGLNEYNQKIIEFVYYNAFITSLGNISYD